VDAHNVARGPHPQTSNLTWSSTLATIAAKWAKHRCCNVKGKYGVKHSPKSSGYRSGTQGENVAWASISVSGAVYPCASAVQQW